MQLSQNAYAEIYELTCWCDLIIFIQKCFVLQDRVQEETDLHAGESPQMGC